MEVWGGGAARLSPGWGSIYSWGELPYSGNQYLHCLGNQRYPKLDGLQPAPLFLGSPDPSRGSSSPTALPGLIPQPGACRVVLMFRQLQELLCNADNIRPEKKMDKKKALPMTFFSSVCWNKKDTSSAWSAQSVSNALFSKDAKPAAANEYPSLDFEPSLYCIILVHLF